MRQMKACYDLDDGIRHTDAAWHYRSQIDRATQFPTEIVVASGSANTFSVICTSVLEETSKKEYE